MGHSAEDNKKFPFLLWSCCFCCCCCCCF